ncbi:hypothetical protein RBE51_21535 [Pseudomonas taiwanensis]|uniref:hypothetical protein n=1 Tax=Pseudomonas taiwanensis TaxID=470150 RepID=UPI0028E01B70|nr:hypothetical protein [Pseudomonas taiwanensis]MDT8925382.1 hypothetical protein [Pseudomonas taiwanensis]
MHTLSKRLNQAKAEVEDFVKHGSTLRLTHAYRELKDVMATAAIEGHLGLVQHTMSYVGSMGNYLPDNTRLAPAMATAYCNEFDPIPEMLALIDSPTLAMHERFVESFLHSKKLRSAHELALPVEKMCKAGHYQLVGRIMDWLLEWHRGKQFDRDNRFLAETAQLLNVFARHAAWDSLNDSQDADDHGATRSGLLQALKGFETHGDTLKAMCDPDSDIRDDLLDGGWLDPAVIRGLFTAGQVKHAEHMFHQYCMIVVDDKLITGMLAAGLTLDPEAVARRIAICEDAGSGRYGLSAIVMHLASAGSIPAAIDFSIMGGKVVAVFISKQCQAFGAQHPELCVQLIERFLEFNDSTGLAAHGLPREILEQCPRLAEEDLSTALGL